MVEAEVCITKHVKFQFSVADKFCADDELEVNMENCVKVKFYVNGEFFADGFGFNVDVEFCVTVKFSVNVHRWTSGLM